MSRRARAMKVYPRVCGGTAVGALLALVAGGLSPRVRGNQGEARPARGSPGSIPACAGEPASRKAAGHSPGVYPRVCGGTQVDAALTDKRHGLSPRVRGNPHQAGAPELVPRSIPACAGEPSAR